MKISEMIMVALEGVWVNRMRSILTMLGIIIGVMSVIIIVCLGQSLQVKGNQTVESLGANSFTVGPTTNDQGQTGRLTLDDCKFLKDSIDSIDFVVPIANPKTPFALQTPRKKEQCILLATTHDLLKCSNVSIVSGRFFNDAENSMGRRVAVIDRTTADDLYGTGSNPVGQTVQINGLPFTVCGLCKPESLMGIHQGYVYMPITTYLEIQNTNKLDVALFQVKSNELMTSATTRTKNLLALRQSLEDGFVISTNEQLKDQFNVILNAITAVFSALAGIALLVGGIGIMNIMMVSVTERTREIGVRMALGARRRDILLQFLIESLVISALGGLIGMLLGISIEAIIATLLEMPVVVSVYVILIAFLFSTGIGMIFGLYPANRAARQNPIDALRYE